MNHYPYTVTASNFYPSVERKGPFDDYEEGLYTKLACALCRANCGGRGTGCEEWCNDICTHSNGHEQGAVNSANFSSIHHVKMAMHHLVMADRMLASLIVVLPGDGILGSNRPENSCRRCENEYAQRCNGKPGQRLPSYRDYNWCRSVC
ncbi:MAG: hypothetical protein S4CHLAM102_14780 [Chlamydiia bacterium]|nr:hypothetical protein [Chlamydiia bacterium]